MSCIPGMPCYNVDVVYTYYPSGCVSDGFLGYPINSDYVYYSGANLPGSGVQFKDTLTAALQKIDSKITPVALTQAILSVLETNPGYLAALCLLLTQCAVVTTSTTSTTTTAAP